MGSLYHDRICILLDLLFLDMRKVFTCENNDGKILKAGSLLYFIQSVVRVLGRYAHIQNHAIHFAAVERFYTFAYRPADFRSYIKTLKEKSECMRMFGILFNN